MILNQEDILIPREKHGDKSICMGWYDFLRGTIDEKELFKDSELIKNKIIHKVNKDGTQVWSLPIDETIGLQCTKEAIEMLENNEYIQKNFEMDITKYADDYYSVYFDKKQTER